MRSFKHHLSTAQELDALHFGATPKAVVRRLEEGISKFEIDVSDLYVDAPPTNSSKRTKYELEELVKLAKPGFSSGLIELPVMNLVQALLDENDTPQEFGGLRHSVYSQIVGRYQSGQPCVDSRFTKHQIGQALVQ